MAPGLFKFSMGLAALGGFMILGLGALFAFLVASGGLYGRGVLADGTWLEWSVGIAVLAVSAIPMAVIGFLYRLSRNAERPHPLLIAFLWTVLVIGAPLTVLSLVDGPPEPVLPFAVFILGLFGYLLTWFRATA